MARRPRHSTSATLIGTADVVKTGAPRLDWRDPYHAALSLRWPGFMAAVLGYYLTVNALFALLYALDPHSINNAPNFIDRFFFSIETFATVGYGVMSPADLYGHLLSAIEILLGLLSTAIITGLLFVRLSRPRAKLIFSRLAVIGQFDGKPALILRVTNPRSSAMLEAEARLSVVLRRPTAEGGVFYLSRDLRIERAHMQVFALTWSIIHVIDSSSPLLGMDAEALRNADARVVLSIEGTDAALSAPVHALYTYGYADIRHGRRFVDVIAIRADGGRVLDLTRVHDTEAIATDDG